MTTLDRRSFLGRSALVAGGVVLGAGSAAGLAARAANAGTGPQLARRGHGSYGALAPRPAENDGVTYIELPEGFRYTAFGQTGTPMTDGKPTPPAHDGMAAYSAPDGIRLVRNHEARTQGPAIDMATAYDTLAQGGTTTLVVDPATRLPVKSFISLSGTHTNCAGGLTPWGSWLTCEETTTGPGSGYNQPHGYVFEVPALADAPVTPVPLKAMGRFTHEAIAIDPSTGFVYLTEDEGTAGIYRFIPNNPGVLADGGQLEILSVLDQPGYDTRTGQSVGAGLKCKWLPIDDPDPADAEDESLSVFNQGQAQGAATFARLEGAWFGDGFVYFHSTSGGDAGLGQVWLLRPYGTTNKCRIELVYESDDALHLDGPDNITVSPRGGLVLCEDGGGDQYLRGLTRKGEIFDFAKNVLAGFDGSEFAGACYSPDGETLFANIQTPGVTLAIWGPWDDGSL